ncbi:MAG: polyketide synthase dehydratase domain-containing protein, partial [Pseudomonadota bacterium]
DCARVAERRVKVLASFAQNDDRTDPVGDTIRRALVSGAAVDDTVVFGRKDAPPDILPAYPWQHRYFRAERSAEEVRIMRPLDHAFLGQRIRADEMEWRGTLSTDRLPFLADHKVEDAVVFPAAGFVEMVLAAGEALYPATPLELSNFDIFAPLVLDEAEREVRTTEIAPRTVLISSRVRLSDDAWTPHVKATIGPAPAPPKACDDGRATPSADARVMSAQALYGLTGAFGLPYGPAFRRAEDVAICGQRGRVRLAAPDPAMARHHFKLDPTLFDACFHGLFAFIAEAEGAPDGGVALLPVRIDRLRLSASAAVPVDAEIEVRRPAAEVAEADFTLRDAAGGVIARAEGVRFQAVPLAAERPPMVRAEPCLRRLSRIYDPSAVSVTLPAHLIGADPEPSETALLVEAGVQAAAAAALGPILDAPAPLAARCAAGALSAEALPLAARLLQALEASGAAEEVDDAWRLVPTALDVNSVVELLLTEHPERLAEAAVIAALPERFAAAFAGGFEGAPGLSDALAQLLLTDAPLSRPIYNALVALLESVVAANGADSLTVCLVGAGNTGFLRRAMSLVDPSRMEITITDADDGVLERAALLLRRAPAVRTATLAALGADDHRFDLVVMAPTLAAQDLEIIASLALPGGVVAGAAYAPSLFADAVGGLERTWWDGSVELEAPLGRLADAQEWTERLATAGLEDVSIEPLSESETDALLFSGRRALLPAPLPPLVQPEVSAFGMQASRIADALSALSFEPEPADGEARPALLAVSVEQANALPAALDELGRRLLALGTEARRVTIVTFGAHGENERDIDPLGAAVNAFARTAMNEMPHLDMRLVDIAPRFDVSAAAVRLHKELEQPNDEREIVLSSDHRSAVRYLPSAEGEEPGEEVGLAIPRRGSIDHLVWRARQAEPLEAGEVRLTVKAVGLNFRDVMWTLGLLPFEALQDGYAGPTLGMECAGTVSEVAPDVTEFQVGDEVMAFAPASFASHVRVRSDAVVRRPQSLSAEAAATIPVAFLTAFYGPLFLIEADYSSHF